MSDTANSPSPSNLETLAQQITAEFGFTGLAVLKGSGNAVDVWPPTWADYQTSRDLLAQVNSIAKKMHLKRPPVLVFYDYEASNGKWEAADSNAVALQLSDGTPVVAIGIPLIKALSENAPQNFKSTALERLVAISAHEEAHIKNKDGKHVVGAASAMQELNADRTAMQATCNPQAFKEAMQMLEQDEAATSCFKPYPPASGTAHSVTGDVAAVYADVQEVFKRTGAKINPEGCSHLPVEGITMLKGLLAGLDPQDSEAHPLLPTRVALADYMATHPPHSCKKR